MAFRLVGNKFVNTNDPQFQLYNAIGRNEGAANNDNFFAKRGNSIENAFGTTGAVLYETGGNLPAAVIAGLTGGDYTSHRSRLQNEKTDRLLKENEGKMSDIYKKYGYANADDYYDQSEREMNEIFGRYGVADAGDYWSRRYDAGNDSAAVAAIDKEREDLISRMNEQDAARARYFDNIQRELIGQSNSNVDTMRQNAADYNDYVKNNYASQKINQDRGKFLGSAINTLSTGVDVLLPGYGVALNAAQGGIEGIADELEQNGLQNFDWGRAGQNAGIGAVTGGVVGGMNKGINNALAKNGGKLFAGNNALARGINKIGSIPGPQNLLGKYGGEAGRVAENAINTVGRGALRGALSGAVGGATGAGLYAATNNGDVIGSALQGAVRGAQQGALAGGVMSGANMALSKAPLMRSINQAGADWQNSGDNFRERLSNTWNSGNSPVANRITDITSRTGNFGKEYTAFDNNPNGAISYLNNRQQGVAKGAIPTAEDGTVDLPYGREDYYYNQRRKQPGGGVGLAHIEADDGRTVQDAYDMVDTFGNGRRVESDNPTRIAYENADGTRRAIISTDFEGKEVDPYVLSAYSKKAPAAESKLNLDTAGASEATIPQSNKIVNTKKSYDAVDPTTRKVTSYSDKEVRSLAKKATFNGTKQVWDDDIATLDLDDNGWKLAEIYAQNSGMNGPLDSRLRQIVDVSSPENAKFMEWVKNMGGNGLDLSGTQRVNRNAMSERTFNDYQNAVDKINKFLEADSEGIPQTAPAYGRVEAAYDDAVKTLRDTYTDAELTDMLRGDAKPKVKSLVEAAMKMQPQNSPRVLSVSGKDEQYTFASDDNTPQAIKQAALDYAYETDGRVDPSELTEFYNAAQKFEGDIHSLAEQYSMETGGRIDPNEYVDFMMQKNTKAPINLPAYQDMDRDAFDRMYANDVKFKKVVDDWAKDVGMSPADALSYSETWDDIRAGYNQDVNAQTFNGSQTRSYSQALNEGLDKGLSGPELGDELAPYSGLPKKVSANDLYNLAQKDSDIRKAVSFVAAQLADDGETPTYDMVAKDHWNEVRAQYAQAQNYEGPGDYFDGADIGDYTMPKPETEVYRAVTGETPEDINSAFNTKDSNTFKKQNKAQVLGQRLQNAAKKQKYSALFDALDEKTALRATDTNAPEKLSQLGFEPENYGEFAKTSNYINEVVDDLAKKSDVKVNLPDLPAELSPENIDVALTDDGVRKYNDYIKQIVADGDSPTQYSATELLDKSRWLGNKAEKIAKTATGADVAKALKQAKYILRDHASEALDNAGVFGDATDDNIANGLAKLGFDEKVQDYYTNAIDGKSPTAGDLIRRSSLAEQARDMYSEMGKTKFRTSASHTSTNPLTQLYRSSGLEEPMNAVLRSTVAPVAGGLTKGAGKALEAVGNVYAKATGGEPTAKAPKTAQKTQAATPEYNPATQLYNAIGRTEGSINAKEPEATSVADYIAAASTETSEAPTSATSLYNSVANTTANPSDWTSILSSAMRLAMAAGDSAAFGQLYSMYQDASSKKQSTENVKLSDKQRQANAAARALEDMEGAKNNFGYDISDVPVLGGIVNMTGNDYKAKAEALALQVGYMLSGATVNAQEAKNIGMAYVPQPRESEAERKRKLSQLRKIISDYQKTYAE